MLKLNPYPKTMCRNTTLHEGRYYTLWVKKLEAAAAVLAAKLEKLAAEKETIDKKPAVGKKEAYGCQEAEESCKKRGGY